MKYLKIILIAIIGIILPFAIVIVSIKYNVLADLVDPILYLYPIYLPVFCGWFGIKLFKETGKILWPTVIFNLFLAFGTYYLTEIIFNSIERSLADVVIGLLLYGPMVYSFPVSPIAAAICKYRKKKYNAQNFEQAE